MKRIGIFIFYPTLTQNFIELDLLVVLDWLEKLLIVSNHHFNQTNYLQAQTNKAKVHMSRNDVIIAYALSGIFTVSF